MALIRREPDGAQVEHHWFVQHSAELADQADLPESFMADYRARYDADAAIAASDRWRRSSRSGMTWQSSDTW